MKSLLVLTFIAISANVYSQVAPARKAIVACNFIKLIGPSSELESLDDGKLTYTINLDSKDVEVGCVNAEVCLLDGSPRTHELTTTIDKEVSFLPIIQTSPRGNFSTIHTNLPAINIEGGNGDDMDMFTRISFSVNKVGNKWMTKAKAVLIYADQGNDGLVSAPTDCTVTPL